MVIYCILNPDAKCPFDLDAKHARQQLSSLAQFDIPKFIKNKLAAKEKPIHSQNYTNLRNMEELKILNQIYEECTAFDPPQRLTVKQVKDLLTSTDHHFHVVPLAVSQNTGLERYDMEIAAGVSENYEQFLEENAINACSFISVVLGDMILSPADSSIDAMQTDFKANIVSLAEHSITDYPRYFNPHRDSEQMYDPQEAYNILRKAEVITNDYELTEEILISDCVYSDEGRRKFLDAMDKLLEMQRSEQDVSVAIYTFGKYVLLIGCIQNKFFLVDSHPVVEDANGKHTGVALFTDGHQTQSCLVYEWLVERFRKSGVAAGNMQSFATLCK